MKGLYPRLIIAFGAIMLILTIGLGIVLGQFFSLFTVNIDHKTERTYWIFLFSVLTISFLIYLFICSRVIRQYAKPVDDVTDTAVRIASGDYLARAPLDEQEPSNQLGVALNQIARNLQEMSIMQTMEKERLKTLVESMGSGLLMFGRQGSVNISNGVFEKTFNVEGDELIGKTFKEIGLPQEIEELIEDVFMTEQVHEKQIRIEVHNQTSHLSVYGAPVIGRHGNWLGIIIVMHDITELIRLEEVRKDFVANVSHELRTPITSIKGFTETLLDGAMEDRNILREFLDIIYKESNRLHVLINDLLELSGIEREGFQITLTPVKLATVLNDAAKIVSGMMKRKQMTLHLNVPEDIIVEADTDRLIQVMVNLLSNAVNYSKAHTKVTVFVTTTQSEVQINVEDQGIGIEKTELPRLFERFYRVDRARSRESGGTGLGLAIVKHLVEAHKGRVTVTSEIGVGTTFTIHLPRVHPEMNHSK